MGYLSMDMILTQPPERNMVIVISFLRLMLGIGIFTIIIIADEIHQWGVVVKLTVIMVVKPQTQKGSKHEKNISKIPVNFSFLDKSIQIIHIKYQH